MRFLVLLLALLPVACADVRPGSPEACSIERRGGFTITQVPDGRPAVEVRVNGQPVRLLLDTGANTTVITSSVAERLKLRRDGVGRSTVTGVGGKMVSTPADLDQFEFASLALPVRQVVSAPLDAQAIGGTDGLLGIDVLRQFDVELDLLAGSGTLYRARNCPAVRPAGLLPMTTFDIPPTAGAGQLQILVELDGKKVHALLDTGATSWLVDRRAALRLGVTEAALAADRTMTNHGVVSANTGTPVHRFGQLKIGGATVTNPEIPVAEMPPTGADMILGMNYMRTRKLWISFSSRQIHVSALQRRP